MTINNASDLQTIWDQRALHYGQEHMGMDQMVDAYDGHLPPELAGYFHEEMHVHIINMIRLAWDDLSWLAGKEFPIYVAPEGNSPTEKDRAERLEKWGYGVNAAGRNAGGVTMKSLMKVLMWWLVGTGNAVGMVLPDFKHQSPYFTWRDPRTAFPPVGWTPWNETAPSDMLFAYQKPISQLVRDYPEAEDRLRRAATRMHSVGALPTRSTNLSEDETWLWVGEYYHEDCWMVATLDDSAITLVESNTGDKGHPGVQPAISMSMYSASGAKGRSLFADQLSIQAAMSRMFSQKLDFYDRTLYPMIFTTPLAGKNIKIGPYAINEFDTGMGITPRVDAIGPTNAIDADQTMDFVMGLSRILNRNPEQMQGAGDADSAKALEALRKGTTDTIREGIWPSAIETLPAMYSAAARMDQNLWGRTTKQARGKRKNANFNLTYRPRTLLEGNEYTFEIEPGVGLSGYQGTLEILQLVGAELMSEDDALEQGEWVREPQEAKKRIQANRMEKLIWQSLMIRAQAPPGVPGSLKPGAMDKLRKMTNEDDMDLFEAIGQLEAAGELYETAPPPMDPMAMLMGGGGPPGMAPPGGQSGLEEMLPPPQMGALQRGAP